MNHEIQSRRILKYWTIRKLSADTCSATWCWSAWSVSKRRRETKMLIPFHIFPREMGLLIEERVKFEHVCPISLSNNFGLRLLLPSWTAFFLRLSNTNSLTRESRASTWFWSTNCQTERRPLVFQQFQVYRGFVYKAIDHPPLSVTLLFLSLVFNSYSWIIEKLVCNCSYKDLDDFIYKNWK